MKSKIFPIIVLSAFILLPITLVAADEPAENLYTGNSLYYLCSLNEDEIITLNLTTHGAGNFSMYLLDSRPIRDNTDMTAVVSSGLNITYNATNSQIYYIQVKLNADGPAVFTLLCNKDLERYFIPQIPGFPLELIVVFSGIGIIFAYFIIKKRKIKMCN